MKRKASCSTAPWSIVKPFTKGPTIDAVAKSNLKKCLEVLVVVFVYFLACAILLVPMTDDLELPLAFGTISHSAWPDLALLWFFTAGCRHHKQ